jgi:hypothetical protein
VKHEPLQSLIPLDGLKKVVAGLVAVPKDAIAKSKPEPNERG